VKRYIENPRRSPRVPARCTVALTRGGDGWQAETEDLGPGGCLVVTPRPLRPGEPVGLHIESEHVAQPLRIQGRVAWVGQGSQQRAGVSFGVEQLGSRPDPAAWFRALCLAEPGIAPRRSDVPDRIACDAPLYLRPPPKFIVDFTPEELAVLGVLDTGVTVEEVLSHPDAGPHAGRVIFALLARRAITLAAVEAVPAWQWRPVLERALGRPLGHVPRARPQAPAAEPAPSARPDILPAITTPEPRASAAPPRRIAPLPLDVPPTQARPSATPTPRAPRAQEYLDQARAAAEANDVGAAIAFLRRALTFSPGDPEIASLLGQMAFKDRWV
jgi:PilZ domain